MFMTHNRDSVHVMCTDVEISDNAICFGALLSDITDLVPIQKAGFQDEMNLRGSFIFQGEA